MNQAKVDYKKIEIVSNMFSDHSPLRLDTKYRKKNNNNKTKLKKHKHMKAKHHTSE